MVRSDSDGTHRTRRSYLAGSAALGTALLAGCSGTQSDDETTSETSTSASDGTYTAAISPVGDVAFDAVPERVMVYSLIYADAAVTYGHGDAVNSLGFDSQAGGNTLDAYYDRLDGVSFDHADLTQLNSGTGSVSVDKELFYELDSDLHLVDPALVASFDGWDESDIEEIRDNVAPWFGNIYSRHDSTPPEPYADDYQYYTLWEIAARVADVFQEQEKYERLASVHDDLVSTIRSNLPPEDERPTVASVIYMDGTFYPSKINTAGFANAHVRPLGATDVFASSDVSFEASLDVETLLEADPDVVLHRYGIASYYDVPAIRDELASDPAGQNLSAVQNDRFYPGGHPVQGPLMNLFQLEMTAKQLYPDQFGAWPTYEAGQPYPEIPEDERLFDRADVAAIVTGDA